jgi:hypothetical protein
MILQQLKWEDYLRGVKGIVSHSVDSKLIGPSLSTGYHKIYKGKRKYNFILKAKARSDCRSITVFEVMAANLLATKRLLIPSCKQLRPIHYSTLNKGYSRYPLYSCGEHHHRGCRYKAKNKRTIRYCSGFLFFNRFKI